MIGWRRNIAALFAICSGFAMLVDWLFYDQPIGWTVGLLGFTLTLAIKVRHYPDSKSLQSYVVCILLIGILVGFS